VKAALEQLGSLLERHPSDPEWAVTVKLLAFPACLIGSIALAIWGLRAYEDLPDSRLGMAALTVAFMSGVGLCGGLMFFVLGALLTKFGGANPVPLSVVSYTLLLGLCLGGACSVFLLGRIER